MESDISDGYHLIIHLQYNAGCLRSDVAGFTSKDWIVGKCSCRHPQRALRRALRARHRAPAPGRCCSQLEVARIDSHLKKQETNLAVDYVRDSRTSLCTTLNKSNQRLLNFIIVKSLIKQPAKTVKAIVDHMLSSVSYIRLTSLHPTIKLRFWLDEVDLYDTTQAYDQPIVTSGVWSTTSLELLGA